ncbi:GDP-mannose 4,6-dehydratase [Actinomycetospora sp.]|uniref:GDP-mannose 4,6-dehydratase n=1 Tax=Actinomycetospora sp. TaxID=1872135 RepID=UPI002F42BEC1
MSSPQRTAVITGITGQDGSYLAELLLAKGYEVHGLARRVSSGATARIDHLLADPDEGLPGVVLHEGDLTDASRLVSLLSTVAPDEIYHLGGQSDVAASFAQPESTGDSTGLGTIRLLEAVRMIDLDVRVLHAASAQMFGSTPPPQHEDSPFHPRSPYALAKVTAYWATRSAREIHGTHAVNAILFNHESPRRGETFVTRRIARAAAGVALGRRRTVTLGNLDAVRDWGFAPEYVEGMWAMLQGDEPVDHVLATGTAYTVEDFARLCFAHVGLDWTRHVRFDERRLRPGEVDTLVGDPSRAVRELGWRPRTFVTELARIMVDAELSTIEGPVSGLTSLAG